MSLRETKRRHNRAETEESSSPILHDAHLEAKAHALAERDSATEPSVLAVAEMNLEEYPAFRLGRRSKRPEIRYVRSRTEPNGRAFEQVWVVRGAEGLGLPGPFEQDLYVALLVLFTEQGLPADGRIRFTRNRLAQIMNCSNSGRGYELIEQGLDRLAGATIHTEHAFFRPGPVGSAGERSGPSERLSLTFHILEEVRVYERCAAVLEEDSPTGEKHPRVEHARPLELSVARLGLPLVQSYERRYTKGLDATFYFSLTRPLAKRLYRYVDKVRNGRGSFEIGIRALADVLGLEYRYPSDIKDGLVEAHAELEEQGFLAEARYAPLAGGPTAGEKVIYGFQAAFDRRPRRRAGTVAPPHQAELEVERSTPLAHSPSSHQERTAEPAASTLQAELESFGITPKRAATLLASHSEEHVAARIEYVRALVRNPDGRRVKNPAGYLSRAIEESYTLPLLVAPASAQQPAPSRANTESAPDTSTPLAAAVVTQYSAPVALKSSEAKLPTKDAPDSDPMSSQEASPEHSGPWGDLSAALKQRLSDATYAAWILLAQPANQGQPPGQAKTLTLYLPNSFALDRWRRPPIAPALTEASASLGLTVSLQIGSPDP